MHSTPEAATSHAWRIGSVAVTPGPDRAPLRVAVRERGPATAPVVLCVHGLTRHGHDFDALAETLSAEWRVLLPDLPGRGDSDWCAQASDYGDTLYLDALDAVLRSAAADAVHWVGTSLGAVLGMRMAQRRPALLRSLVLNDSGPEVDGASLVALRAGARERPGFADLESARPYLRQRYAGIGIQTPQDWAAVEQHALRREADGLLRMRFDPHVVSDAPLPERVDHWSLWQQVRCPVLILRGEHSSILSRATCERMVQGRADAQWIEIPGAGHAPYLAGPERLGPVGAFLRQAHRITNPLPGAPHAV